MYIVRDTMFLKFGHFREARTLLEEAEKKNLLPKAVSQRILSDFTGDSYRLILEQGIQQPCGLRGVFARRYGYLRVEAMVRTI